MKMMVKEYELDQFLTVLDQNDRCYDIELFSIDRLRHDRTYKVTIHKPKKEKE